MDVAEIPTIEVYLNESQVSQREVFEPEEEKRAAELLRLDTEIKRRASQEDAFELLPESNFGFGDDASDDEN